MSASSFKTMEEFPWQQVAGTKKWVWEGSSRFWKACLRPYWSLPHPHSAQSPQIPRSSHSGHPPILWHLPLYTQCSVSWCQMQEGWVYLQKSNSKLVKTPTNSLDKKIGLKLSLAIKFLKNVLFLLYWITHIFMKTLICFHACTICTSPAALLNYPSFPLLCFISYSCLNVFDVIVSLFYFHNHAHIQCYPIQHWLINFPSPHTLSPWIFQLYEPSTPCVCVSKILYLKKHLFVYKVTCIRYLFKIEMYLISDQIKTQMSDSYILTI